MPNLVAVDVSVTDNRLSLVFSHRAVAAAYAAYLRAQDLRPPQYQTIPGYKREPQLHAATKEVSVALPGFMTWFITCRLPDDEDAVTFTFMDADAEQARRWAEGMVLFELVPPGPAAPSPSYPYSYHYSSPSYSGSSPSPSPPSSPSSRRPDDHRRRSHHYRHHDDGSLKQLHVRRLWNKERLLKRLEELRRRAPTPPGTVVNGYARSQAGKSRVASPVWGEQGGGGGGGEGAGYGGSGHGGHGSGGGNGNMNGDGNMNGNGDGRVLLPVMGPMQGGTTDIWW